jgi:hypothetical protein
MQSRVHKRFGRQAVVAGVGSLSLLAAAVLLGTVAHGCNQGREGDRCNPNLLPEAGFTYGENEDECGTGLSCQQPVDCPENYCCPTSGPSTNPFCQPGCNGGQASICAAGGDADCSQLEGGPAEGSDGG